MAAASPAGVHGAVGSAGLGDLLTFHRLVELAWDDPDAPADAGAAEEPARDAADPSATPPSDRRPAREGSGRAGGPSPAGGTPTDPPPGEAISGVARSDSGPGHGDDVSATAHDTDKPADR
jgi:hypothetical protein